MIYLFDLDNTIANMDHRIVLLDRDEIDWDEFERQCVHDTPIASTISVINSLYDNGEQVWIWTGRSDGVRYETVEWLRDNHVPYHQLLMRPHGSDVTTTHLKRRWLDNDPVPRRKVAAAFDDDPRIIKMLNSEGILCYQVKHPGEIDV